VRTMSRITRKHEVVCLHVISVPYHADGVNLQQMAHSGVLAPHSRPAVFPTPSVVIGVAGLY